MLSDQPGLQMLPCLKAKISKIGKQEQQETSPTGIAQSLNLDSPFSRESCFHIVTQHLSYS